MKHLLKLIIFAILADVMFASAQTIGSFTVGSAAVTSGGYVSLYAQNVTESGGSIAGVRFYRESNGTSGLQTSSDTYVGMGVFANGMWTFAAPTTGLSGSQTFYAVAYDTAGNASSVANVTASVTASGFGNWSSLQPFLAITPLSIGQILSTSVVNFGTTVYTGPLDTTITLDRIRADNGPNRTGDGALFTNNGNPPLPTNRGSFYEFTINPQTGCTPNWTTSQIAFPGPLRFMIDTSGDIYFTGDHYSTDLNLYIAGTPSVGSVAASPASATAGTAVTLTASSVSETISPSPNLNADTGANVLATVCNVQFFIDMNGASGLQTDTDRVLGCGTQSGSTWTLTNVSTMGLVAGTYTVYAVGYDPAGNTSTQTTALTITGTIGNQPPSVTTSTASGITTNSATLNGSLNPNGQSATAQFEYGLTTSYGTIVALAGAFTGSSSIIVSTNLVGLTPGTTYHFRLDATNANGLTLGSDQSFTTTTNQAPSVTTSAASSVVTNAATLNGSLNPNGQTSTAQLEYGLTTSYGSIVNLNGTFTGSVSIAVSTNLAGLTPGTTYHFRLDATNASGLTLGSDQSFTTVSTNTGGGISYSGVLAGWETSGLSSYGPSPFAATTNAPNLTVIGLTRGSGVGTVNTAGANAWGGTGFFYTNEATAISGNSFATFSITATAGYTVSFTNVPTYNVRRSSAGSTTGIWQYQLGAGTFTDIGSAITWGTVTTSAGNPQSAIDLSGIAVLQNVTAGTTVTFRIVLWGGTGSGSWYVNNITGIDLQVFGSVASTAAPNTAPNFTAPISGTNIVINAGTNLSVSCTATDSDSPAQTLTYTMLAGPTNATVNSSTGNLLWRPLVTQANSVSQIKVVVTDSGTPNMSATNSFSITVNPLILPTITAASVAGGQFQCVINGQAGPDYSVQVSTSLSSGTWSQLFSTNSPALPFTFTDPNVIQPRQFYRIVIGP